MRESATLVERNTTTGISRPPGYNSTETYSALELFPKSRRGQLSGWCADWVRPVWTRFGASFVAQRLAHGTFWALSGSLAARAAGLVSSIAAARFLGKTAFGEFAMIQSTAGMFAVFAGFGLGLAATKHVAELRKTDTAKLGRILAVSGMMVTLAGAITAAALFLAAGWIASGPLAAPHLAGPLRLGAALLLFDATSSAQTGALSGFEAFRSIASINLWVGVTSIPITIAGVWIAGLRGAIWALIATRALTVLLSHRALRKQLHLARISMRVAGCLMELKTLLNFSLPSVISSVITVCAGWACNEILVKRPNGYADLGLFNAASQWRAVIYFLPFTISVACLPIATSLYAERRYSAYTKLLCLTGAVNLAAVIGLAAPIAILSGPLMAAYGHGFSAGAAVLVVLCCSCLVLPTEYVTTHALICQGSMWSYLGYTVLLAALLVTSTSYFVARGLGPLGMAYAIVLSYLVKSACQTGHVFVTTRRALAARCD